MSEQVMLSLKALDMNEAELRYVRKICVKISRKGLDFIHV